MEYYGNCNLPPREAYVFLTGQQAVVKTNIGCKRMYLEKTERDGAQLAGAFELRSGLTLERTATRHPWIPQELDMYTRNYIACSRLHELRGEHAEARRYLTQALEIFERLGTLLEPDKVRKELGELPGEGFHRGGIPLWSVRCPIG